MAINGTINRVRYLKRNDLTEEAAIIGNYYRDIIQSYGVDVRYFKQDTEYPLVMNPSLSSYENLIYGENDNTSYSMSADMIVFMEVEGDIFQVRREGTIPEDHYTMTFMIDDFSNTFSKYLGGNDEFNTLLNVSGEVSSYTTTISSDFDIENLSGNVYKEFDFTSLPSSGYFQPTVTKYNDFSYNIPINPYIVSPTYYLNDEPEESSSFIGEYTSSLDASGNGTINTSISGSLLYTTIESLSPYQDKLKPVVGDFIKLDFPGGDNYEEYEITHVWDRQLTDDGVNPLLHKYVYKCDIIRRVPDHEDVFGDDTFMEKPTSDLKEIMETEQCIRAEVSDEIDSYEDEVDDVYGGYGLDCYGNEMTPTLRGFDISGSSTITEQTSGQYICIGNYSDGSTSVITPEWSVSNDGVISNDGVLTTGDIEINTETTLVAKFDGLFDTHKITIEYVPFIDDSGDI